MSRLPRWVWLLLLAVPVAIGLLRLRFDTEVLNLLPAKLPVVQGLKLYQQHFASGDELLITLASQDAETTERSARVIAEKLRDHTNLVRRVTWQAPWLENPGASAELLAYLWLNQPADVFGELTNRLTGAGVTNTLLSTREQLATSFSPEQIARLAYDPFGLMNLPESATGNVPSMSSGKDFFSSADGTFRIVFIEPAADVRNYRAAKEWLSAVQAIIKRDEITAGVSMGMTGSPVFISEISQDMERDMRNSVLGTGFIIAALFWWAHRRLRPLLWLLVLLGLILIGTMAFGGLIYGSLNVVSLGFAAILLGLAVDYGLVLFQEAKAEPDRTIREVTRLIAPSIGWAALTTAGAFLFLTLSGLPGLGQLGSLVAIGTVLAAAIMVFAYLPPLAKTLKFTATQPAVSANTGDNAYGKWVWLVTAAVLVSAIVVLWKRPPTFDHSPESLRPNKSQAYQTLDRIKTELSGRDEPLWVILSGTSETEISQLLNKTEKRLQLAVSNQLISSYTLPTALWPHPENQRINRPTIERLLAGKDEMRQTALSLDFAPDSLLLTEQFLNTWQRAIETPIFWPTNNVSRWALEKVATRENGEFFALGLIYPITNATSTAAANYEATEKFAASWPSDLSKEGAILSGWTVLGSEMFDMVRQELPRVIIPMLGLVLLALFLAFRRATEVLLSCATLIFAALALGAIMGLAGWSWNLMNMMAAPLLLGVGVDYTIHMQLALKRHHGNILQARRTVGRALLLCGGTTIAGFGSLAFSSNAGMASLGQVCSVGIAGCMLATIFLLPTWWKTLTRNPVR